MVETKSGPAGRAEGSVTSHVYGGDGTAKDGALATDSGVAAARPRQAYTVVSLFSGCGGMDLGFEQAGFRIEVASDHCRAAADTYRSNSAGTEFVEDDITDPATKQAIVAACGGRCDVVIGGPPCGPYSRSGERDPNDPRARLFEDYLDLVGRLRPKVAVMENVVPLLSARNPAGGLVYDEIVEGFKRLGYVVDSKALCAADYGVPQRRARLIIIATRLGVTIRFPEPTHAEDGETSGRLPWRTMRNAIGDLEDAAEDEQWSHVFTRHTSEVAARYAATPIGGKGCVNYNEGFYRNPPDQPSITLKTAAWPLHYRHGREITCREAARIQSFPDEVLFVGGKTAVAEMIGNAVPPLLAKAVACCVREMLDEAAVAAQAAPTTVIEPAPAQAESGSPAMQRETPPTRAVSDQEPHKLLLNGSSKKGSLVWSFSIAMPNGRCPFASSICSRWCYAEAGKFPLNQHIYERNCEASKAADFADRLRDEVVALAWRNSGRQIAVCAHEKGEFHSLDYLRAWGRVIRETMSFPNLSYFVYTRCWVNPDFRAELDLISAECRNVRINLSLDREMVEQHGLPARVGDGLLVYLCETDRDLPPPGVDVVFRNLRLLNHEPLERLGGALVCPNESGLYVSVAGGRPVLKGGRTTRIRCQECRLCCVDGGLGRWERIKGRHAGTPGTPAPCGSTLTVERGGPRADADAVGVARANRPFLRWAGGKSNMAGTIAGIVPPATVRLMEPFVGGAAVALNVDAPAYLLADANTDLMAAYEFLVRRPDEFIRDCMALFEDGDCSPGWYAELRGEYDASIDAYRRACLFVYLNRHCYNGLVRYNEAGRFNSSFGGVVRRRLPEAGMRAFARRLGNGRATFAAADFRDTMAGARAGDFVYCDPPYVPVGASGFTSYVSGGFGLRDHEDLADLCEAAARAGATVAVSNHDCALSRRLYSGADRLIELRARRSISCDGTARGKAGEIIAIWQPRRPV